MLCPHRNKTERSRKENLRDCSVPGENKNGSIGKANKKPLQVEKVRSREECTLLTTLDRHLRKGKGEITINNRSEKGHASH